MDTNIVADQGSIGTIPSAQYLYTSNQLGDPANTLGTSNTILSEYSALTIPAFYSGARFLAETLANLPKNVKQRINNIPSDKPDHSVQDIIGDEPNELVTSSTFWSTWFLHAVVWSNAYAFIKRDKLGTPLGVYNLLPDRVMPFRFNGATYYGILLEGENKPVVLTSDEVMHLPALSYNGLSGLPMVRLMGQALQIGKYAESYGKNYYKNGGHLMGAVLTKKSLSAEQLDAMRQQITQNHAGLDNAHKWIVLSGAGEDISVENLTAPMETAQHNETKTFAINDVCRMLRLPPHLVYELTKGATYSSIESMSLEVVKYSLNNWIVPTEQEIDRKLFTRQERKAGYFSNFNVDALQRGDTGAQIASATAKVNNGLGTINEQRAELWELPPVEGGDIIRVSANTVPLGQLDNPNVNNIHKSPVAQPGASGAVPEPSKAPIAEQVPGEKNSNPSNAEIFANKEHFNLNHFSDLFVDATDRVHKKTSKALEGALKKHATNPLGFTAWSNVFASEQNSYTTTCLKPIFQTYANLSGKCIEGLAIKCGQQYEKALKLHFSDIAAKRESMVPDLMKIIETNEQK